MDQVKLFNQGLLVLVIWNHLAVYKLFLLHKNTWKIELIMSNSTTWNYLTVCKQMIDTVMVPTLWTIMNSSYYYEYWENIYLGVKLTLA